MLNFFSTCWSLVRGLTVTGHSFRKGEGRGRSRKLGPGRIGAWKRDGRGVVGEGGPEEATDESSPAWTLCLTGHHWQGRHRSPG